MHTALWPATGGYFLEQMMAPAFTLDEARQARRYFIDYVRARGPLPALRIGTQPYGVLPATSLDQWQAAGAAAQEQRFVEVLRRLRAIWRAALPHVPRIGRSPDQARAEQDLFAVLNTNATSSAYDARLVVDRLFFGTPAIPGPVSTPSQLAERLQAAREFWRQLGVDWEPRLNDMLQAHDTFPLAAALVQPGPLSETEGLSVNYIDWLRRQAYETIRDEAALPPPGDPPEALLYRLLRHATLLAYATAAFRIQLSAGAVTMAEHPEPVLVDLLNGAGGVAERTRTLGRHPEHGLPGIAGKPIHRVGRSDHPEGSVLDEFRASLDHLKALPTARLEPLLTETLDLFTYRLDAWVTSLATRRLDQLRAQQPRGLYLGGFGWVEDLRPGTTPHRRGAPAGRRGRSPVRGGGQRRVRAGALAGSGGDRGHFAQWLSRGEKGRTAAGRLPSTCPRNGCGWRNSCWTGCARATARRLARLSLERGLHEHHPDVELDQFIELFRLLAPFDEIYKARSELAAWGEPRQEMGATRQRR